MTKASIKGFELRGIREFKGHEQEQLFQGNIYYQGQRVGWFSQDAWGGEEHIDLPRDIYDIAERVAKEYLPTRYPKSEFLWSIGTLFNELVELLSIRNFLLEIQKDNNGKGVVLAYSIDHSWLSERQVGCSSEEYAIRYAKINNLFVEKIYKDLNDFIIE